MKGSNTVADKDKRGWPPLYLEESKYRGVGGLVEGYITACHLGSGTAATQAIVPIIILACCMYSSE